MVSDTELVGRLHEVLEASDLETTTAAGVRRRLEEEFSVNLYERRVFIREQIDQFLRNGAAQNDVAEQQEEAEQVDDNAQNDAVAQEQGHSENTGEDEIAQEEEVSEEEQVSDKGRNKRKKSIATDVKKKVGGFCKPCALSPQLQELFGVSELARTEVVKKLWAYIREHNLQNPKDRRKILCDEALHGIFKAKSIGMFSMNKALSKHIWPLDEVETTSPCTPVTSSQRKRQRKQDSEEDEPKTKEKPKKGAIRKR